MTVVLRTPVRRIVFAIALSAMVHAAILWLPYLQLPHREVRLPPLTARLELLPKPVAQPAAKPEPVSLPSKPGGGSPAKLTSNTAYAMKAMERSTAIQPFPRHVQLTFIADKGAAVFRSGEFRHQLDIYGDRYTLKSVRRTVGPTSLLNGSQLVQTSRGRIDEHGLRPETFKEEEITSSGQQNREATFDWVAQILHFSDNDDAALSADAQDALSFMYQLAKLLQPPIHWEFFSLPISDGTHLENYQIEIGAKEDIATPMGKLRTLHLREMHDQGKAYFEIWLGLEYRLLPVKFRRVDGSGNVTEEFAISDMRASDE